MKAITHLTLLVFLMTLGSCATSVKFPVSTIVPAAEGSASIKKDNNNNYLIDLKVKYLASPDRLTPARQHYVVWIVTADGTNINLGMLVSDSNNNASLKGVSSSKPVQILVTAEDTGDAKWPGKQELFRTQDLNL